MEVGNRAFAGLWGRTTRTTQDRRHPRVAGDAEDVVAIRKFKKEINEGVWGG